MKNKYEIRGDVTVIYVKSKGIELEFLIDTDDLELVSSFRTTWSANVSADKKHVYAQTILTDNNKYTRFVLHRVIMKCPDGVVVDHINHNTLDNRKSNLRNTTNKVNARNLKGASSSNKSSGIRGVCWSNTLNKWISYVHVDKKPIKLGCFDDIRTAEMIAQKGRDILHNGAVDIDNILPSKTKQNSNNVSSKIRNVSWRNDIRKWQVRIYFNNKMHSFGCYDDLEKASEIAKIERDKLHSH